MSTHIGAPEGAVAKRILLPGDPMRAKYIAENYLEGAVCFNTVRNMLGYTGTYQGKPVSVMGTGMGMSSCAIYVHELICDYGVDTLIRIGTAGAISETLKLGDVVIANGASTTSDMNRHLFPGTYCPLADFELARAAYRIAKDRGYPFAVGNILSSDLFYDEDRGEGIERWKQYGILAGEMESAALYTLAQKHRVRALCLATVSDGISIRGELSAQERERSLDVMIRLGLDTAVSVPDREEAVK